MLSKSFTKYFLKETYDNFDWILTLFVNAKTYLLGSVEEESTEFSSDQTSRAFWLSVAQGYIEHRDSLLKFAADSSGAKQKVTLCTFFSNIR